MRVRVRVTVRVSVRLKLGLRVRLNGRIRVEWIFIPMVTDERINGGSVTAFRYRWSDPCHRQVGKDRWLGMEGRGMG